MAGESIEMKRALPILFLALLVNSAYVAALPTATVFYMGNVLLHVVLGIAAAAAGLRRNGRGRTASFPRRSSKT